jgi:hypothetical protein
MSAVTGRFTSSPESAMEFDLAQLRNVTDPEEFVRRLNNVCSIALTNDFWSVKLPNDLATSSSRSPSLFAYNAALVLLDARVLFSKTKMAEMLDPALNSNRAAIERHHLFPKGYLEKIGITSTRETNQIANYAYVEWMDNVKIGDNPPSEYVSQMEDRFSSSELSVMYHHHALPQNWVNSSFNDFLQKRRELISQIIREGYERLSSDSIIQEENFDVYSIIDQGESEEVEFKSTLRVNLHTGEADKRIEMSVLKTLAGFLNNNGGTLIIGLSDEGAPVGLEADKFTNEDKMNLHLVNIVKEHMGPQVLLSMHANFEDFDGEKVMVIRCSNSQTPVFVKDGNIERFFVRTGPSTTELTASQTQEYISRKRIVTPTNVF